MTANDDQAADEHYADVRNLIDTSGHWLDFEVGVQFEDGPPPDKLIRFMPLDQYLSILTNKKMYFPCATEFDDPMECDYSEQYFQMIAEALMTSAPEPEFSLPGEIDVTPYLEECEGLLYEQIVEKFSANPATCFVSCWHSGDVNTELMWRSYGGHRGVAIVCDGPKLLRQFSETINVSRNYLAKGDSRDHFDFNYGSVHYGYEVELGHDTDLGSAPTVYDRLAAFQKHRSFHLDSEYRFVAQLRSDDARFFKASADFDLTSVDAVVHTSPLCPDWFAKCIFDVTRTYYPELPVQRLDFD